MEETRRAVAVALAVAFVAGVVHALRPSIATVGVQMFELDVTTLSYATTATAFLSVLVNPFAVFAAGYRWGTTADVAGTFRPFLVRAFGASALGFVVTLFPLHLALDVSPASWIAYATMFATSVVELAVVPLVALAGSAVAEFRLPSRAEQTNGGQR